MKKVILTAGAIVFGLLGISQTNNNVIDFENGNYSSSGTPQNHIPNEGNTVDNVYFKTNYGVEFSHTPPGSTVVPPIYAKLGAPTVGFINVPTLTPQPSVCKLMTQESEDYPYASTTNTGCFFITDDNPGYSNPPQPLYMIYDQTFSSWPAFKASGYIYDIDGPEAYNITGYDAFGIPVSAPTNLNATGNGDGTSAYWEIISNQNPIAYIAITWAGNPSITTVGVGYDNFAPYTLQEAPPCGLVPDMLFQVSGCGVQFTDLSTASLGTQIIGYQWTFTDLNTGIQYISTDQNPFQQFSSNAQIHAELVVTGYNGTECCTDKIETDFNVEKCEPCSGEISFSWTADTCSPCVMTFNAQVVNNTTAVVGYYWEITDQNTGSTAVYSGKSLKVSVPSSNLVCLTVIFSGDIGANDCCTKTICAEVSCGKDGQTKLGGKSMKSNTEENSDELLFESGDYNDNISSTVNIAKVYPNPTDDLMNVELVMEKEEIMDIDLISTNGQVIKVESSKIFNKGTNVIQFETSEVPAGLYIIRIQNTEFSLTRKLSIRH